MGKFISPADVAYDSPLVVWWKCSTCGYDWQDSVYNRAIKNTGCPKCEKEVKDDQINRIILDDRETEIDALICHAIYQLNKRGYKTFTCCSGHNRKDSFYGYICFDKLIPKILGKPVGWEFDNILLANEEQGRWKQSKRTIRYFMEDNDDKKIKIKLMMKNLEDWVEKLPNLK